MLLKTQKKIDEIERANPVIFKNLLKYVIEINTYYAIYYEKIFVELLEKNYIHYDCKKLQNYMGGNIYNSSPGRSLERECCASTTLSFNGTNKNMNKISMKNKIFKYLYKYENNKQFNYGQKILRYVDGKYMQNGGNMINIDNISLLISKIINTDIFLMPDIPKYKSLDNPISPDCDDSNSFVINNLYNNHATSIIKNKYLNDNIICNKQYFFNNKKYYTEAYEYYMLKRKLKAVITDAFMLSLSDEKYYNLLHYIFFTLNLYISKFVDIYNDTIIVIPANFLTLHDIYISYKGGNTLRQHLKLFMKNLRRFGINDFPILDNLLKDNKRGDFDFMINVNFGNNYIKGLTGKNKIQFINKILQVINIALIDIKNNISFIENGYSDISDYIKNNINNMEADINTYINEFNTRNGRNVLLKKFSVITNNHIFNKNIINDNNKYLEHKSYIIQKPIPPPPGTGHINKFNKLTYYETQNAIFADNDLNIYQNSLMYSDNIFISFIERIIGTRLIMFTEFSLYRLKIENKISIDFDDNNNIINENINIPVELIDISFPNHRNTKITYIEDNVKPRLGNQHDIYTDLIFNINNIENIITIPSPLYMYYDIAIMLFYEQIFVWENLKFEKRIKRLIWYIALHYISIGTPILTIIANMNALLVEFTTMAPLVNDNINIAYRGNLEYKKLVDNRYMFTLKNKNIGILYNEMIEDLYRMKLILDFLRDTPIDPITNKLTHVIINPANLTDYDNCKYLLDNIQINIDLTGKRYNATENLETVEDHKLKINKHNKKFTKYINTTIDIINNEIIQFLSTITVANIHYDYHVTELE